MKVVSCFLLCVVAWVLLVTPILFCVELFDKSGSLILGTWSLVLTGILLSSFFSTSKVRVGEFVPGSDLLLAGILVCNLGTGDASSLEGGTSEGVAAILLLAANLSARDINLPFLTTSFDCGTLVPGMSWNLLVSNINAFAVLTTTFCCLLLVLVDLIARGVTTARSLENVAIFSLSARLNNGVVEITSSVVASTFSFGNVSAVCGMIFSSGNEASVLLIIPIAGTLFPCVSPPATISFGLTSAAMSGAETQVAGSSVLGRRSQGRRWGGAFVPPHSAVTRRQRLRQGGRGEEGAHGGSRRAQVYRGARDEQLGARRTFWNSRNAPWTSSGV